MFEGAQLAEVHETYAADGKTLLSRTRVLREAEWSDDDRARALALMDYESGFCPCGCNQPILEAYDPKQSYLVKTIKCQARRAIEQVRRDDHDEKKHPDRKPGWDDGLRYYVTPVETPAAALVPVKERARRARQARQKETPDA